MYSARLSVSELVITRPNEYYALLQERATLIPRNSHTIWGEGLSDKPGGAIPAATLFKLGRKGNPDVLDHKDSSVTKANGAAG